MNALGSLHRKGLANTLFTRSLGLQRSSETIPAVSLFWLVLVLSKIMILILIRQIIHSYLKKIL